MADPFELLDLNPKGKTTAARTGVSAARVIRRASIGFDYPVLKDRPLEGGGSDEPAEDEEEPTFSQAQLEAAVDAARKEAEAETEARVRAMMLHAFEHRQAEALAAIAAGLSAAGQAFDAWLEARSGASRMLALAAARALAREALARQPLAEVEALLREMLVRLDGCPWLTLHLPPDLVEAGHAMIAEIAAASGYRGSVEVNADPILEPGAARLDWADGRAIRDPAALDREVEALIQAWLPPDPPSSPEEEDTSRPPSADDRTEPPPRDADAVTSGEEASPASAPTAPSPQPDERQVP